jgi:hypothetical protein
VVWAIEAVVVTTRVVEIVIEVGATPVVVVILASIVASVVVALGTVGSDGSGSCLVEVVAVASSSFLLIDSVSAIFSAVCLRSLRVSHLNLHLHRLILNQTDIRLGIVWHVHSTLSL